MKNLHKYIFWIFLILLVMFRYFSIKPKYSEGDMVRISDTVAGEPIRYETTQRVLVGGLKVYLPLYPEINYGDKIVVEGRVEDGGLSNAELVELEETENPIYGLRKRLLEKYKRHLPEPYASLVAGVTIGSKGEIPEEFWEALKITGTAHVVVASGMNVTLVAGFLMSVLVLVLERKKAVPLAVAGIWVYSVVSGFDAPIIRAAVMGSIAFSAQELGRLYDAQRALIVSALLMLVINPLWIKDLGFILSFVATASLMIFESRISSYLYYVPRIFREGLSTSLAAQVGVAPILYITFGQFNLLSPIINALVLWTIAPITIIGMLGGIASLVVEPLGRLLLYLEYPLSYWFVSVIRIFSG
jgi:competence protein ComEC